MRTEQEYKNLEAERDALKLALENSSNRHIYEAPEGMCFMPADTPDRLDALAARVAEMREALERIAAYPIKPYQELGYSGCRKAAQEALATPDDSTAILARRDALTLDQAATRMAKKVPLGSGLEDCIYALEQWSEELRARAAELGKAHGL